MTENIIPVSPEEHGKNISDIQTYLREIHQSGANVRSVIPDGIYGQHTRDAVSDFQRSIGIPETGEVNKDTWNAIYAAYDDARRNLNMQEGITPFPALDEIMTEGDSGTSVLMLQAMLNTIAGMHINIAMNDMNGYYGENTAPCRVGDTGSVGTSPHRADGYPHLEHHCTHFQRRRRGRLSL